MRGMVQCKLGRIVLATALLLAGGQAAMAQYRAERVTAAPPQELAPAVREVLDSSAIRVVGPEGALCEVWLRKDVPARATPEQMLGVSYGDFSEGTLFGVIRFLQEAKDYRRQAVKPGVYTLRFALLLVDGNHMGVSPNRDYFLLSPAAEDTGLAALAPQELYGLSRKASGTSHPSIWSLTPPESAPAGLPAMLHHAEENHWILLFEVNAKPEGAAAKKVTVGLVVVGSAPEA